VIAGRAGALTVLGVVLAEVEVKKTPGAKLFLGVKPGVRNCGFHRVNRAQAEGSVIRIDRSFCLRPVSFVKSTIPRTRLHLLGIASPLGPALPLPAP
jgi:hypothetical protein